MPHPPYDESLFEETKMTFGEHLEELRRALFKSVAAIVVGFLLGLMFGKPLVDAVTGPLESALHRYHTGQQVPALCAEFRRQQELGELLPPALQDIADWEGKAAQARVARWLKIQPYFPEEVYVQSGDVQALFHAAPEGSPDSPTSDPQATIPQATGEGATQGEDATPVAHAARPAQQRDPSGGSGPQLEPPPAEDRMLPFTIWRPLANDPRFTVQTLNVQEGFMIYVKVSLVAGVIFASPFVFWAIWTFVAAGLYPHERSYVHVFLPVSLTLFLAGVALAYFGVIRFVLDFLLSFNAWLGFDPVPRISEWLNFVLFLPLGFGLAFQLPLVMLFLERIGIMTVEGYLEKWRIAIMVIAVLSMVLTPADPMSMIFLGVPLTLLYFGGIAMCRFMPKNRSPFADALD